jgi:DNA topoisomerase-1
MSAKKLVVVESPAKAKTLSRYLGRDFVVKASVGHVVDLPKNKLGVDVEKDFEPDYEIIHGKGKVIAELKSALKGKEIIYLGPDPDREGEAIAYHLAEKVVPKNFKGKVYRVLFNEITKNAVRAAIDHPVEIDSHKFEAQQARRVIDRLVGYQISPLLWEKVRRGLSAGRVQSVAVRLIVEREREISAFRQVEYWQITAGLESGGSRFSARLVQVGDRKIETRDLAPDDPKCFFLRDEAQARALVERLGKTAQWRVAAVKETRRQRRAPAPFITSTLQQEASRKHGFQPRRTMSIAQKLYEGVELGQAGMTGLITYMRTDSTRTAGEALSAVRGFIEKSYGGDYVPEKPNFFATRKSAQEAHEAIRPTSMEFTPERVRTYLEPDALKLYTLIWNRFVASQMLPAVYDQTSADIAADDCVFRANGQVLRFDGFLRVYQEGRDVPEEDDESATLPALREGDTPALREIVPSQHFTQPPPRFTQASLIRVLEEKGIGRPSTYAAIMSTIIDRDYVKQDEQKRLVPTQLGMLVTDLLVEAFPDILNETFTADLESDLDAVESGDRDWLSVTRGFYAPFKADLEKAAVEMRDVKRDVEETDLPCPNCGKKLVIKWGRNGEFLACPAYPECKFTSNFTRDEAGNLKVETPEETGETCEKCGAPMVFKFGRFGKFLGCSNYPECRNVKSMRKSVPLGIACPAPPLGCGEGKLQQKISRRGKVFYGCDCYPKCKFATWDRPVEQPCPQCGAPFLVEKTTKRAGTVRRCLREGCDYSETVGEGFSLADETAREAEGAGG